MPPSKPSLLIMAPKGAGAAPSDEGDESGESGEFSGDGMSESDDVPGSTVTIPASSIPNAQVGQSGTFTVASIDQGNVTLTIQTDDTEAPAPMAPDGGGLGSDFDSKMPGA